MLGMEQVFDDADRLRWRISRLMELGRLDPDQGKKLLSEVLVVRNHAEQILKESEGITSL